MLCAAFVGPGRLMQLEHACSLKYARRFHPEWLATCCSNTSLALILHALLVCLLKVKTRLQQAVCHQSYSYTHGHQQAYPCVSVSHAMSTSKPIHEQRCADPCTSKPIHELRCADPWAEPAFLMQAYRFLWLLSEAVLMFAASRSPDEYLVTLNTPWSVCTIVLLWLPYDLSMIFSAVVCLFFNCSYVCPMTFP